MSLELAGEGECCVVVKCERVKEEPGLEQHESSSAEEEAGGRTECGVSAAAARAGLYAGHEVKGELVLGPTALQPPDSAFAPSVGSERSGPELTSHHRLRACSVRLERLPKGKISLETRLKDVQRQTNRRSLLRHIQLHSSDVHLQAPTGSAPNIVRNESCFTQTVPLLTTRRKQSPRLTQKSQDDTAENPLKCKLCKKWFACKNTLVNHAQNHTGVYECKICSKKFRWKETLVRHELRHMEEKPYKCKICWKMFSLKQRLVRHELIHTGEKLYKCKICSKKFSWKQTLVRHQSITGEKPYKCKICCKNFPLQQGLVRHELIHTGEKPYKCKICSKKFPLKSRLIRHELIHMEEKPYKCKICWKMFALKQRLVRHELIHTGEKPYKCKICSKKFSWKQTLVRHESITGEKPYKCKICCKNFSLQQGLVRHELICTYRRKTECKYECKICSKKFPWKYRLIQHELIHTGEKPYKCKSWKKFSLKYN